MGKVNFSTASLALQLPAPYYYHKEYEHLMSHKNNSCFIESPHFPLFFSKSHNSCGNPSIKLRYRSQCHHFAIVIVFVIHIYLLGIRLRDVIPSFVPPRSHVFCCIRICYVCFLFSGWWGLLGNCRIRFEV